MSRQLTLTDEERLENERELNSAPISIRIGDGLLKKLNKFSKRYQSRNHAILDLIKTHPDFLEMFPPLKVVIKK